ncbi:MAG: biotin--[acetyl-CoA-carboxylase] ligase, partial [Muribaculaceae bacterium]|nr:biotin--[acetyl-CoA-carboxylase] ligase [Muribaculaceae bacterium]
MEIIHLEEVDSTNAYIKREAAGLEAPVMVVARSQTAGRGQRGNTWESEPGKNLTFSVLIRPDSFPAISQFSISEATALAVSDFLRLNNIDSKVKWANDIYVGDRKICGILIQHSLAGFNIGYSVLGIGINVN